MIKTLRESKAKLSELVRRASQGEDVLITVRGQVKARLTSATEPGEERAVWIERLKTFKKNTPLPREKLAWRAFWRKPVRIDSEL